MDIIIIFRIEGASLNMTNYNRTNRHDYMLPPFSTIVFSPLKITQILHYNEKIWRHLLRPISWIVDCAVCHFKKLINRDFDLLWANPFNIINCVARSVQCITGFLTKVLLPHLFSLTTNNHLVIQESYGLQYQLIRQELYLLIILHL